MKGSCYCFFTLVAFVIFNKVFHNFKKHSMGIEGIIIIQPSHYCKGKKEIMYLFFFWSTYYGVHKLNEDSHLVSGFVNMCKKFIFA